MNEGKVFENNFKASIPKNMWYYRLKDGTASWGKNDGNVRFQAVNIADCLVFKRPNLYIFELKTHLGTSLPFTAIRLKNLDKMVEASEFDGIVAGFIINFRQIEKTYFVDAEKIKDFIEKAERKSIPQKWCEENGEIIACWKKKVNYKHDVETLINDIKERLKK